MKWITVTVLLGLFNSGFCGHALNKTFIKWMNDNYKPNEVKAFIRDDLITGSFGGGGVPVENSTDRPVVLVHGLNNEAGSLWKIARDFSNAKFQQGYMFATTWGKGVEPMNLNVAMHCGHVLHIRRWIELVLKYTKAPQIDVIGYSMGSPIARKAILGGKCVDNPAIDLGPPLTKRIHTYISVAGANQGSYLCMLPFFDICNMNTGLTCNSKFLGEINWHKNYESSYKSFNLASSADFVVGYMACGKKASEFGGAHEWKVDGKNHEQTEFDTAAIQLQMLREVQAGVSKSRPIAKIAQEKTKKNASAGVKKDLDTKKRDARHLKTPPAASKKASPPKKEAPKKKEDPKKKSAPEKKAVPEKKAASEKKKVAPAKKAAPKKKAAPTKRV